MRGPELKPPIGGKSIPYPDFNQLPHKTIDDIDQDIRRLIEPADLEFIMDLDRKCRDAPHRGYRVMNMTGKRIPYISRNTTSYVLQQPETEHLLDIFNNNDNVFMFPQYSIGLEYLFFAGNVEEAKDYFKFCEGFNAKHPERRLFAENLIVVHNRQLPKEYDLKKMKEFYLAPNNVEVVSLFFPQHTPTDNDSHYEY